MVLSIDLGGTSVKLALVDDNNHLFKRREADVCFDNYRTPIFDTMLREAQSLLQEAGTEIQGIGISATGQIDQYTGTVIGTNGAIPGYEGTQMKQKMEAVFHLPTYVLNDANAALLGEMVSGAAQGFSNVLMVTLGTGVGGSIALGGHLFFGTLGIAGEIGHFTLYADGEHCTCGRKGCYERYASTSALMRRARSLFDDLHMDGHDFFRRCEVGDAVAVKLLEQWRRDIADGLISLIHLLNPELVLIGGGVSSQEELLLQPLREDVMRRTMPCFVRNLQIQRAMLGNNAGLIGAAAWWHQNSDD